MDKPRMLAGWVRVVLFLAAIIALLLWQQKVVRRLESENSKLRQSTLDLQSMREENARLAKEHVDPAELERLRAGQLELARLRGQVAQLRRQIAEAAAKRPAVEPEKTPTAAVEPSAPPVETYTATAQAPVPWNQTLITGGWILPSGKRALVMVRPVPVEGGDIAQLELQTKIMEMPAMALGQMDMAKAGQRKSSLSGVLTSEQTALVMKALEQMEGVNVLAAPKVITVDGRQAQVKVVDVKTAPSGETYEVGPSIDIVPKISADGTSVDLNVTAQLRLPSNPAK